MAPQVPSWQTLIMLFMAAALLASACGGPGGPATPGAGEAAKSAVKKRITVGIMSVPTEVSRVFVSAGSGTVPGGDALEELLNAGLTQTDGLGVRRGQLAEDTPTVENGLWKVFPDGKMETSWRIKGNAQWHDGMPVTSADLLFLAALGQDAELPIFGFGSRVAPLIEGVDAPDARTVVVRWNQVFIRADSLFDQRTNTVRPKHILEGPYRENKLSLLSHPYWIDQFLGAGPFKMQEWVAGSHVVVEAFEGYVFGRPRLDEIVIKFIPDPRTLAANILAGEVELTLGRNISIQQAVQIQQGGWREGKMDVGLSNWIRLQPNFRNPNPAVLLNLQYRRALIHAIDRQELSDTLLSGMSPVAHTWLSPREPIYKHVESSIVKYDYDPRRAAQLIEGLGYAKGPDGIYRDAAGDRLALEVRTSGGDDLHETGVLIVVDYFKRIGIEAEPYFVPPAERADRVAQVSYPGVRLYRNPNDPLAADRYRTPLRARPDDEPIYSNPELDALIDRYMTTVSERERVPLLSSILRHQTENMTDFHLWYNLEVIVVGNRLQNVTNKQTGQANQAWNAHQWDVS